MKKSVPNYLHLEPRPKMWQNFDTEGIVHKEFVPPGQTVNGKFYRNVLRQLSEVIWHNVQTSGATTPRACIMTMLRITCRLLCSSFWLLRIRQSSPTLPTHRTLPPVIFFLFPKIILKLKGWSFDLLKRPWPNRRTWWWRWHKMTSSSASDHENPAGITVSMQKGTTSKGMGAKRNFGKWLSYDRGISGTTG